MFILIPTIFGSVLVIVAYLLYRFDFSKLANLGKRPPKITALPIVTPSGHIVSTAEDLDLHIEFLKDRLDDKEKDLELSRNKIICVEDNLKRLTDTTNEVRKYYLKLRNEIERVDDECRELTMQIEDYKSRQHRLRDEISENVKYYSDMLTNIDGVSGSNSSNNADYELVRRPSSTHDN